MTAQDDSLQVFTPVAVGGLRLWNRFIRSAAFEGMCADGKPSAAPVDHHQSGSPDAGGVGP
jgi:2,4-dienoyl-CoA reductase-like NADH-dependent reductase (Old Yellow Enzyme family)